MFIDKFDWSGYVNTLLATMFINIVECFPCQMENKKFVGDNVANTIVGNKVQKYF